MHFTRFLSALSLLSLICCNALCAQVDLDKRLTEYAISSLPSLKEFLALPNDAHYPADIEANVQWCERQFKERGFITERLETETVPLLLAERRQNGAGRKTVLIYLQIDGQPVDPSFWFQEDPYKVVLKEESTEGGWEEQPWDLLFSGRIDPEWRLFARSTADSKGAAHMFLTAMDMINAEDFFPDFDMKVIMDFEEEIGSPRLPAAVSRYRDELASDMLIIFDGPRHIVNKPTLTFGARGISTVTLRVFGPVFPQHSGHYGNYVPNPAVRLSRLIASMKDDHGRVTIPGFYDGINLDQKTLEVLQAVPDDEAYINARMGIAQPDRVAPTYQESIQYPSLNVRGMSSGWVGDEVRTIVPSVAIAEIDIRLVVESDPDRLLKLVKDHIANEGYLILDRKPNSMERAKYDRICQMETTTSYLAFRTDFDSVVGRWLSGALRTAFGEEPIKQRTSGGSIPISPFVTKLGIPAVTVPTVNRDNNQHSPNENIRLGNYIDGIKTIYHILVEPLSDY